jgi:hypothetical protein
MLGRFALVPSFRPSVVLGQNQYVSGDETDIAARSEHSDRLFFSFAVGIEG